MSLMQSEASHLKSALILGLVLCGLTACGTITPPAPKPRGIATFSGNKLNGGIGSPQYDAQGNFVGFSVDSNFVTTFNQYVKDYGVYLLPPYPVPLPAGTTMITAQQKVQWLDLQEQPQLGKKKQTLLQKIVLLNVPDFTIER